MSLYLQEKDYYEQERKRCAETYPDWKNDEFNCGPLKFIAAVGAATEKSKELSFNTLNDIIIYLNRDNNKLYMDVDGDFNNLSEIVKALEKITAQLNSLSK